MMRCYCQLSAAPLLKGDINEMSALFLDLLEGLDTLCQNGATAPPLGSVRQTIATSSNDVCLLNAHLAEADSTAWSKLKHPFPKLQMVKEVL